MTIPEIENRLKELEIRTKILEEKRNKNLSELYKKIDWCLQI